MSSSVLTPQIFCLYNNSHLVFGQLYLTGYVHITLPESWKKMQTLYSCHTIIYSIRRLVYINFMWNCQLHAMYWRNYTVHFAQYIMHFVSIIAIIYSKYVWVLSLVLTLCLAFSDLHHMNIIYFVCCSTTKQ